MNFTSPAHRFDAGTGIDCPRLSKDEQYELIRRAQAGDREARDTMVRSVFPLIVKYSGAFVRKCRGIDVRDLIIEATISVIRAVEKFDTSKNVVFITYARFWIREALLRVQQDNFTLVSGARAAIQRHGVTRVAKHEDRLHEIIQDPIARKRVEQALSTRDVELEIDVEDDGERYVQRSALAIDPDQSELVASRELAEAVAGALEHLDDRERDIIQRRYFHREENLAEIGEAYGLSRERIRQLEQRALKKLEKSLRRFA